MALEPFENHGFFSLYCMLFGINDGGSDRFPRSFLITSYASITLPSKIPEHRREAKRLKFKA